MFYAHFVLAKKGPLSRIWLAAHWDKKLTKAHVFETNIESSVDGILQPKVKMALRTSGHLLLGVVRIYSRKAKYLLSDCNEAFVKIKMAFRPGMVDLPEENREAAINAITLPEVFHDFDTAMPDLDDVDIHQQLSMNQTRAEEITMREDYGNINLEAVDDGFGEQIGSPEMLRENDLGGDGMSLLDNQSLMDDERSQALGYTHSMIGSKAGSVMGDITRAASPAPSARSTRVSHLDAPIQDDGFGGTVGAATGQDVLAGGLFEDGSLFDDGPPPSMPASERVPESTYDDGDNFGGPPSPGPSSPSESRPATPLNNPSVVDQDESPSSPTPSHASIRSAAPSVHESVHESIPETNKNTETTTLIQNEEESFALAPVEASNIRGLTQRAKRKRKLIVDEVKAISGEEMKAQLSDTNDIITTLDLAPPTKRLMHWKETGGVEKLFVLPGRVLSSRNISKDYNENLVARSSGDERFETLLGDDQEDLPLEYVKEAAQDSHSPSPDKKENRGRKRKSDEKLPKVSEYQKRQEELQRQMEETLRNEKNAAEASMEVSAHAQSNLPLPDQSPAHDTYRPDTPGYQSPGYSDYQPPGPGETPTCATPQYHDNTQAPAFNSFNNHTGDAGFNQLVDQPPVFNASTVSNPTPEPFPPSEPELQSLPEPVPELPAAQPGADFTDAWVSQAANATATGAALYPHQNTDDWDEARPDSGMSGGRYSEEDDDGGDDEEEEDEEYMDQETVDEFEDRVLNKRAAKLHFKMKKLFQDASSLTYADIEKKKDTKKDGAQKFYSLLVLQKFETLDISQTSIYGDLNIVKGPTFDSDSALVN